MKETGSEQAEIMNGGNQEVTDETMELQVINHVQQEFKWNFSEIKAVVTDFSNRFVGLVVTEENLKVMEAAQKELASKRVKLDTFRKEKKKLMEEPIKQFEVEIKELQALIDAVETPLKDQIQKFEDERIACREKEIREFAKEEAHIKGLREENFTQFIVLPEWTRRGAKEAAVNKAVMKNIELLVEHQKNADEAETMRKQKIELIAKMCELYSRMLKTPITPEEIAHLTHDVTLAQIPEVVMAECNKRLEVEAKAAEANAAEDAQINIPSPYVLPLPPIGGITKSVSVGPPLYSEDQYDVDLRLPGITVAQANEVLAFFASRRISYEVLRQTKIGGALPDVSGY